MHGTGYECIVEARRETVGSVGSPRSGPHADFVFRDSYNYDTSFEPYYSGSRRGRRSDRIPYKQIILGYSGIPAYAKEARRYSVNAAADEASRALTATERDLSVGPPRSEERTRRRDALAQEDKVPKERYLRV